jgi:predicted small lipoprotein YifL
MRHASRSAIAWLVPLALLLAACGSSGSSEKPSATPSAPPEQEEYVLCPSPNPDEFDCSQTDLTWQSGADQETWFRIYMSGTGEGDGNDIPTCSDVQGEAQVVLETEPGARSAQLLAELSTGGGYTCLWITAVNEAGESAQVPAAGQ